jgi:hypothetical protein
MSVMERLSFTLRSMSKATHKFCSQAPLPLLRSHVILTTTRLCTPVDGVDHLVSHQGVLERGHRMTLVQADPRERIPSLADRVCGIRSSRKGDEFQLWFGGGGHLERGRGDLDVAHRTFEDEGSLGTRNLPIKTFPRERVAGGVGDVGDTTAIDQPGVHGDIVVSRFMADPGRFPVIVHDLEFGTVVDEDGRYVFEFSEDPAERIDRVTEWDRQQVGPVVDV